jgi:hypothetical protein
MNLGMILKLAKGGFDPDQLTELARGMGWNLDLQDLMRDQRPMAFQRAAAAAVEPDSRVLAIWGTDAQGNRVEALLVLVPIEKAKKIA